MPGTAYSRETHTLKAINRGLMLVIMLMALALVGSIGLYWNLSKTDTLWVPPDTSNGAMVQKNMPDKANIYGFSNYIMQYLYHWPIDGAEDYKKNVFDLSFYITPNFKAWLDKDYGTSANFAGINELSGRQRMLLPLDQKRYSSASVKPLADGVWEITLYYQLREHYKREKIKDTPMRYRLRVVRSEVDPERNAWGLKIDGFVESPSRVEIGD